MPFSVAAIPWISPSSSFLVAFAADVIASPMSSCPWITSNISLMTFVAVMSSLVHRAMSSKFSSGVRGCLNTRASSSASCPLFLPSEVSFGAGEPMASRSSFFSSPDARAAWLGSAMARFRRDVKACRTRRDKPFGKFQSISLQMPTNKHSHHRSLSSMAWIS